MRFVNILLWILVVILLSSFASADFNDSLDVCYDYEGDADDFFNRYNGTVNGAFLTTGIIGQAYGYNAGGDEIDYGTAQQLGYTDEYFTVRLWVKPNTTNNMVLAGRSNWDTDGWLINEGIPVAGMVSPYMVWSYSSAKRRYCYTTDTACNLTTNNWHHIVTQRTGTGVNTAFKFWVNGNECGSVSCTGDTPVGDPRNESGQKFLTGTTNRTYNDFDGAIDELAIWRRNLTPTEIATDYNSGAGLTCTFAQGTSINFTAVDSFNSSAIDSFSVNISWHNGTNETYNTVSGSIGLSNVTQSDILINVTYWNMSAYYDEFLLNENITANVSNSVVASVDKLYRVFNFSYSNFTNYTTSNYTRVLAYSFNVSCPDFSVSELQLWADNVSVNTTLLSCTNSSQLVTGSYQNPTESNVSMSFYFNGTSPAADVNGFYGNQSFVFDLFNPTATGNFTTPEGFNTTATNVTLRCYDNVAPVLTYNSSFNSAVLFYGNQSNDTAVSNVSSLVNGANNFTGFCSDFFGTGNLSVSTSVFVKQLILIDERENDFFDVNNISSVKVYFDDNSSVFDFQAAGTNATNFTAVGNEKLRFELVYATGDVITRYIDVSVVNTSDIRVCANKEGVTHFEQLIISATQRRVVMKSVFSDCLVAADYTRFAYQDSFLLKAFTISALYYLYTFDNGNQVLLASVDGSISTYMNLDTLEFAQNTYNLDITGDGLAFEKSAAQEMKIYYHNIDNDNVNVTILISDASTGTTYLDTSELISPNNFTLYFNWATLNVTNTTLFKIELLTSDADGNTGVIKRYFNSLAQSGLINSGVALAVAILLTIFGLTFTATRITLSWFGIGILLMSIGVLSFAIAAWYITLMLVIDIIVMIYIIIVMVNQNYSTISG